VEDHLHTCSQCRQYQNLILNILGEAQKSTALQPNISIRRHLVKRLAGSQTYPFRLWPAVRGVLNKRIPVYQAILIAALLLFAGELSRRMFISQRSVVLTRDSDMRIDHLNEGSIYFLDDFEKYRQQNIGRSAEEDSKYLQYITSSM
jgi:hypothetical protein